MPKKQPPFTNETQEAEWWAKNQNLIAGRFDQAKATGKLGKGTVAQLAGASPTITIRLAEADLTRARTPQSARPGRNKGKRSLSVHQTSSKKP